MIPGVVLFWVCKHFHIRFVPVFFQYAPVARLDRAMGFEPAKAPKAKLNRKQMFSGNTAYLRAYLCDLPRFLLSPISLICSRFARNISTLFLLNNGDNCGADPSVPHIGLGGLSFRLASSPMSGRLVVEVLRRITSVLCDGCVTCVAPFTARCDATAGRIPWSASR